MRSFLLRTLLLMFTSQILIACSDDVTNVYPTTGAQPLQIHDYVNLPSGVVLDGVNAVNFYSSLEGLVVQSEDTSGVAVPVGAFNNATGVGNKAIVGFSQFGGQLMSSLQKLEFEARLDRNTSFSFINIQVDCDGDGDWEITTPAATSDAIVVVDSDFAPSPSLTFDLTPAGSFKRFVMTSTAPLFKSVGGRCGLPPHTDFTGAHLSAMPATAKLFNGATTDGGMPRATSMPAILLVMNDSNNRLSRQITLKEFVVNSVSYKFYQQH